MDGTQRLRIAGFCGIIGGLLWFLQVVSIEILFPQLARVRGTPDFTLTFGSTIVILALLLIGFVGIRWGGGLRGWFGAIAFGGALLGYVLMIVGCVLTLAGAGPLTDPAGGVSLIYILGRLLTALFTLLTAFAVLAARRWRGWRGWTKFVPLFLFLCFAGEFVPVFLGGGGPNGIFTAAWGLFGALLGLAILAQTRSVHGGEAVACARDGELQV
jgi:hypothetical protein